MSVYFITGATGAVGSAVAARLLDEPGARIIALVRGESAGAAAARLDAALARPGMGLQMPERDQRITIVLGDAQRPQFGLSDKNYADLQRSCTHVIHCAGAVRMNLPIDAARNSAVDSVRNVLALARRQAEKGLPHKVEMVSTVGVAGRAHRLLREDWVSADHAFHNTYEQAKAEAEREIRDAMADSLPVTVHRPSMVVGDSRSGYALHFQVFYFLAEFLSGRRTAGMFPDLGDARLDIVPVDFVAEAIVRSSRSVGTAGHILHLCAGSHSAISLVALQAAVREALGRRGEAVPRARSISRGAFRRVARGLQWFVGPQTRAALAALPVFLDYLETEQAFDNSRTREWLEQERIPLPLPHEYLARVLDFYFATRSAS